MEPLNREDKMIKTNYTCDLTNILNIGMSERFDFGSDWFGHPCSESYWNEIRPLVESLSIGKNSGILFRNLESKETKYYMPFLQAFMCELENQLRDNPQAPGKLVEYLLRKLGFPSREKKSTYMITQVNLPKRFIYIGFIPGSKTTLELYLDGGWQFTFKIHDVVSDVKPSLKFDIKIVGMPISALKINSIWK